MKPKTKHALQKYSTFAGCFLLLLPAGVSWYWGNVSTYTDSYFLATQGPESGIGSSWLLTVSMLCFSIGLIINNILYQCISRRWVTITGIVMFDSGILLSGGAVQVSTWALVATIGVMMGLARGILTGQIVLSVIAWSPENVGLWSAIIMNANNCGAMLINQYVTYYINPDNVSPDLKEKITSFFTEKDILDRVPTMFFIFGGMVVTAHIIGFLLIRNPPQECSYKSFLSLDSSKHIGEAESTPRSTYKGISDTQELHGSKSNGEKQNLTGAVITYESTDTVCTNGECPNTFLDPDDIIKTQHQCCDGKSLTNDEIQESDVKRQEQIEILVEKDTNKKADAHQEVKGVDKDTSLISKTNGENSNINGKVAIEDTRQSSRDMTTMDMIKTTECYVVILCCLAAYYASVLLNNYYKTFGQLWMNNDHLLTDAGTINSLAVIFGQVGWGKLLDRGGVKYTLVLYHSALAVVTALWYLTPMLSPKFYIFWIILFGFANGVHRLIISIVALKLFGKTYCNKNAGVVKTVAGVVFLASPVVVGVFLNEYGWFVLFFSGAILNAVTLVIVIIGIPKI